jgi:RHS repeat-associated protein
MKQQNHTFNFLDFSNNPQYPKGDSKMKTRLSLTLLALAAVTLNLHAATSALPAPLPEFMDAAQAAKWTADQEATAKAAEEKETAAATSEPSTQFYTGKPYVADAGGYIYKYRTYNPEMSRWTSADPSGFPDGANNQIYAPIPTGALDPLGLEQTDSKLVTLTSTNFSSFSVWSIVTSPVAATLRTNDINSIFAPGTNNYGFTGIDTYNTTTGAWGTATSAIIGNNYSGSYSDSVTINLLGNSVGASYTFSWGVSLVGTPSVQSSTAYSSGHPATITLQQAFTLNWTQTVTYGAGGTNSQSTTSGASLAEQTVIVTE